MEMRKRNVGTQHIIQVGDRLGIYFLETGGSFCFGADPKDPKDPKISAFLKTVNHSYRNKSNLFINLKISVV